VSWPALGRAALEPITVEPGAREVLVEIAASVISSGTERARFVGLPNARVDFPHRPGCSASGRVIGLDPGVQGFRIGDEVALLDVPHQSIAAVPAERAFLVPAGTSLPDAAILQLALIAGLGVHQARLRSEEPLGIIGVGLIGALAQRLARLQGAGPCTTIARTPAKEGIARAGGAVAFLAVEEQGTSAVQHLELPVVIEATGDPEALALAIDAAAPGGRVIMLGSPRGQAPLALLETIRRKRLLLIGSHITRFEGTPGLGPAGLAAMAGRVLKALAAGSLSVADLLEDVDPREAARLYRRLVNDRELVGARFDWTGFLNGDAPIREGERRSCAPAGTAPQAIPPSAVTDRPGEGLSWGGGPAGVRRQIDRPIRFGFVGCGEIAVFNAEAIATAPNTSTVACFDINPELAHDLAQRHGAVAMPSLPALLERDDVDAVVLSLPHHLHAPTALEAAQAGKHVVVEKPVATDLRSAAELVQAVERTGVALSVCFPERYSTGTTRAKEIVERNGLGDIFMVELLWYADKPPSYWFGGFTGRSASTWRMRPETSGGGVLLMNACHGLDLVRHVTGLEVASVSASTANVGKIGDVEDTFAIEVRFGNGALGIMAGTSTVGGLHHESLRFLGTDGWLGLRPVWEMRTSRRVADLGIKVNVPIRLGPPSPPLVTRSRYFSRFASAVRDNRRPDVTGADGLWVQAVITAAYEAAMSGARVSPAGLLEDFTRPPPQTANRSPERPRKGRSGVTVSGTLTMSGRARSPR